MVFKGGWVMVFKGETFHASKCKRLYDWRRVLEEYQTLISQLSREGAKEEQGGREGGRCGVCCVCCGRGRQVRCVL